MKIDEDKFLKSLFPQLTKDDSIIIPPGDDCAAIKLSDDSLLLVTVDQLSEEIHYYSKDSLNPTCPKKAGRKLLARNISDIAAMAGKPLYALLAISMRSEYDQEWLIEFTAGVLDLARNYNIHIIGGDLAAAKANNASLTLIGTVSSHQVCRRDQANEGDLIFVTGKFGGSLSTEKHLNFKPRLNEALWLAENDYTRAIIDVSDGLIQDLARVCDASSLSAIINEENVPRSNVDNVELPLENAYLDGEDYELLFAVPASMKDQLLDQWPIKVELTEIGRFTKHVKESPISTTEGIDLSPLLKLGFDHFSRSINSVAN